jgi:hypothetical protein
MSVVFRVSDLKYKSDTARAEIAEIRDEENELYALSLVSYPLGRKTESDAALVSLTTKYSGDATSIETRATRRSCAS